MAKLESLIVDMQLETAEIRKGLDQLQKHLKETAEASKGLLNFEALKEVGHLAFEAGEKLVDFALDGAEAADTMGKMAQSVGISVESFSRLNYAAGLSKLSTEEFGQALGKLNINVANAAAGNKETAALFHALGVSVKDANGATRSADQVLGDLAQKFSGLKDGASKGTLAVDLFGKAGKQLIPFLNEGREGIAKLSAEADRFGITVSSSTVAAATEFNDNIEKMHKVIEGVAIQVAAQLAPVMSELTKQFLESKSGASALKETVDVLATALKVLVTVGVALGAAFELVGVAIAGGAASAIAALSGDFRGANEIVKDMQKELGEVSSNAVGRFKAIWDAVGEGPKEAAKTVKKSADDILKSIKGVEEAAKKARLAFELNMKIGGFNQQNAEKGAEFANIGRPEKSVLAAQTSRFQDFYDALDKMTDAQIRAAEFEDLAALQRKNGDELAAESSLAFAEAMKATAKDAERASEGFKIAKERIVEAAAAAAEKVESAFAAIASQLSSKLGDLGSIIQSGVSGFKSGGIWGAIIAVIIELFSRFERFHEIVDKGMKQIEDIIGKLSGVFGGVVDGFLSFMGSMDNLNVLASNLAQGPLRGIGTALRHIGEILGPIFDLIDALLTPIEQLTDFLTSMVDGFSGFDYVIKILGAIINVVSLSILGTANAITEAVYWILEGIRRLAVLVGANDAALEISKVEGKVDEARRGIQAKMTKLWGNVLHTFDEKVADQIDTGAAPVAELGKAADGAANSINKLTEAFTNIPEGVKVRTLQFGATQPDVTNSFGTVVHINVAGSLIHERELADLYERISGERRFRNKGIRPVAWLKLNGIELAAIAAVGNKPKSVVRLIGAKGEAGDGTMRKTRQALKRDLTLKSIPLGGAVAFSWECFINGEGETWSFDANLYGSKGLGPASSSGASVQATGKFGGGKLRLAATSGTITYAAAVNLAGSTSEWTVMVWRLESAVWHHYIVRSDGAKWLDGVRADATSTTWLSVTSGSVTIANTAGSTQDYDDLVVLPFKSLDAWGPIFGVSASAFSLLPKLNATGDVVREQATRSVLGEVSSQEIMRTGSSKEMRELEIALEAV